MTLMGIGVTAVVLTIGVIIGIIALAVFLLATNVGRKAVCNIIANRIMMLLWTRKPRKFKKRA